MSAEKFVAFVALTEEQIADGREWADLVSAVSQARDAARGERYNGVFQRGYQMGAAAAFDALLEFMDKGGRVGLPMGPDSLHIIRPEGGSAEIMSLLALRPWTL